MNDDFHQIGTGLTVYQDDVAVEGPMVWLDSPSEVIDFVSSGRAGDSIVLARGGTTTFLTPALTAGVKGIMTLNGAPESHLGILSREYGIPCIMSVKFTEGTKSGRGEVIPKLGATVRLDISSAPQGAVFVQPAPVRTRRRAARRHPGCPRRWPSRSRSCWPTTAARCHTAAKVTSSTARPSRRGSSSSTPQPSVAGCSGPRSTTC